MSHSTANGLELMSIFISAMNQHYSVALLLEPSFRGMPGEALLQPLLDLYESRRCANILRVVCPFLRSLGRTVRLTNVFDAHNICLVRGSNISKLRVSFRYGDIFSVSEFDISDLSSVLFDLSTGKKVSILFASL